jgi:hypothetical protein
MEISKIETKEDLQYCVNLYYNLNDHEFLDVDPNICYTSLYKLYKQNNFIRVIRKDDKIIAWLLAIKTQALHMSYPQLQQLYYACDQKGFIAYKCVVLLHEALVEEAKLSNIRFCISQGSHMDPENIFAKILEKQGWDRRGHTAALRLPHSGPQRPLPATFFTRG